MYPLIPSLSVEDLVEHLGHRLQPLLPPLVALALAVLREGCAPLASAAANAANNGDGADVEVERARELRSGALKVLAQVRR